VLGVAFVNEASYLKCRGVNACVHITVIQSTGQGYRDFTAHEPTSDGGSYAYTMAGNFFGLTWGAYAGVASYFNTGKTTISTPTNRVYVATPDQKERVTRGASTMGAPAGYDVCIANVAAGKCTATRTFEPGAYKFSIFGYTYESTSSEYSSNFAAALASKQLPTPTTHFVVRTLLTKNFDLTNITFNGGSLSLSDLGNKDVTDFVLTTSLGTFTYKFPSAFNYGQKTQPDLTLEGSCNIKIKVSLASSENLYVDYLVPMGSSGLPPAAWNYFIYDTDIIIKLSAAGKTAPTDSNHFVTINVTMPYSKVRQERYCNLAWILRTSR